MPTLKIDNRIITVAPGATLLEAARGAGIHVPSLCYREGLEPVTSCMICVVRDCRSDSLRPACSTPAEEGMDVETFGDKVSEARRMALDLLLSDHLGDCLGPCRRACPAGINIPAMVRAIAGARFREAVRIVKEQVALPAVLGRICPAPCEKGCRQHHHDGPLQICRLKRFVADLDLAGDEPYRPPPADATGFQAAIVGAGPTGLAAACYLAREGHRCTVFEKANAPGGGLRAEELRIKLPREVLQAEIEEIIKLGVNLKTEVEIGRQITLPQLKEQFDAVILACGRLSPWAAAAFGLAHGRHGIKIDKGSYQTSVPMVFAGGSAVLPSRLAVRAAAHGHGLATMVSRRLRQIPETGHRKQGYSHRPVGINRPGPSAELQPEPETGIRPEPVLEASSGSYSGEQASREAARCLRCDCRKENSCKLRRYAAAYGARQNVWPAAEPAELVRITGNGKLIYEPGKCIVCGICTRVTAQAGEPLGLAFAGRGFEVRVKVPFNASLEAGLGRVAAECVAACPTGALAFFND